jgi:HEPN domain-containing protein
MNEDYKVWLKRARSSLALSKTKPDDEIIFEDLCYQAQQAVEKALKAFLVFFDIDPVRTHNLVNLTKELSKHIAIPVEINDVVMLNDYAVQTRYPGDYTPIEETEYNNSIQIADLCVKWVESSIRKISKELQTQKTQPLLDLFKDYSGESFRTELVNPTEAIGEEKW